ncbi:DUF1217 domain-containing protein [Roseibacterium sp. SDUM158017]|uniref:DUF1217 domain-containing protein n=1 Tax=Roseicyclus salinarum TaxID=3036773 RepID=UPI002414FD86|nr:DUF1217 domain-containing protein [Roseibacterium sp. SDUM158017]MDG4648639.1 DUF1217 domain-containing protein [Roseibacterium sp. SDUM158017]
MIPLSGLSSQLALSLVDATRAPQIERLRDAPEHARGIRSFRERIADVTTVEQLVEDRELYVFVMRAFDLEDQIFGKALIKRMLESDPADPAALVNRLTDPRFREMHDALGFAAGGRGNRDTARGSWQEKMVDRYLETVFINDQAAQNAAVGAALEFRRKAAEIGNPFDILKDRDLSGVVRRALGLPDEMARLDIDRQADLISSRLDIAKLKDPDEVEKIVRKYIVLSDALDPSRVAQNAAVQMLTASAQGRFAPVLFDITAISGLPARPYR